MSEWQHGAPVRFPSGRWEMTFSRALQRRRPGRVEFALPYSPASRWPLPELFCFARLEDIGGAPYIVYAFDEKRAPVF